MSKEMKDFLSQFMNQPAAQPAEIVEKKVVEKKEPKPKVERKIEVKTESAAVVQPKATKTVKLPNAIIAPQKALDTEGVEEMLSAEVFLKSINDKKYTFDKKKNLQIDDQLFAILNLLKQHEGIKSIATLLNGIIEKYIEDNKIELKKILSKNPLG